jgi:hypothetical protein
MIEVRNLSYSFKVGKKGKENEVIVGYHFAQKATNINVLSALRKEL